ncbi:MAG: efflux RND transporter periplasmic adaptor subunit [Magnetococcales bacterium]|nr:efflux RND transporter periplasmic adaptor subunit [Magnetococcales bacterium]
MSWRGMGVAVLLVVGAAGYLGWPERLPAAWSFDLRTFWRKGAATSVVESKGGAPVPVRVIVLEPRPFPVLLETWAVVEPAATVTVKSRLDGQLLKAWFAEGARVHAGDRLFTLDDRTFEAQLQQAQANLARDQAQLDKARLDLKRYTELAKGEVASRGQWESYHSAVAVLTASVAASQAQVEQARLQLSFTRIDAPIDGVAGALRVHPGNTVKNNDTELLVIHQIQPLDVKFSVAEQWLPLLRQRLEQGGQVAVRLPGEADEVEEALLTFINNSVDASTGTLQVKARADNAAGRLWPGQYVRVAITLQSLPQTLVVPDEAIQTGQQGPFVFVIAGDGTAHTRLVKVLARHQGEAAIAGELATGTQVVVDGQLRLSLGAKVSVQEGKGTGRSP